MARKLYVVVRKDLLRVHIPVQVAHAVAEFAAGYPKDFEAWYEASNTLAVLEVPDTSYLEDLCSQAHYESVRMRKFYEPDLGNSLTAVCFEPGVTSERMLRKLDLLS